MGEGARLGIGELSARSGLSRDALRYYERRGLLQAEGRGSNGYRIYSEPALARLRFIQRAQSDGFCLAEIEAMLQLKGRPSPERCLELQRLLSGKLETLERELQRLRRYRAALRRHLAECDTARLDGPTKPCRVLREP